MSAAWMTAFPTDEIAHFQACTCEQIGFIMQMRWYSWVNDGIPNEEGFLKQFAKRCGISKYKFTRVVWPFVKNFFTEVGGYMYYGRDEERRIEAEDKSAKLKEAGKKGAESRWMELRRRSEDRPIIAHGQAIATALPTTSTTTATSNGGGAAAASYQSPPQAELFSQEAAAGPPPDGTQIQNLARAVTDTDYESLCVRAVELGLSAPDRMTAIKILQRFPNIHPSELPKFPSQTSTGLWLHKSPQNVELEIARQQHPELVPRKPTAREEQDQRLLARAMERDRQAGRSA